MKEKKEKTKEEKQDDRREILWVSSIIGVVMLLNTVDICGKIKRARLAKEGKSTVKTMNTAISNNDNIDDKEKKYLEDIKSFLSDYEKYIDEKIAFERLEKFDIIYKENKENGPIITKGSYSGKDDEIIYYITDNDNEEKRKRVISHELLHLVSTHDNYYPKVLNEGITSVICYEYNLNEDSYFKNRLIAYMLCEIVSSETVVESYLKGDFSIIEKKLYEIIPDKKIIEKLEENLNAYYEYNNLTNEYLGKELDEYKDAIYKGYSDARDESLNKIANILCGYYTKKEDKLVGDSKTVEEMFKSGDTNNDYDLKMSIYNTELRKDNYSRFYNFNKKIAIYSITNTFEEKTAYFNKRNEKEVSFYEDGEWAFVIDKDTNTLVNKPDEYYKEDKKLVKEYK